MIDGVEGVMEGTRAGVMDKGGKRGVCGKRDGRSGGKGKQERYKYVTREGREGNKGVIERTEDKKVARIRQERETETEYGET